MATITLAPPSPLKRSLTRMFGSLRHRNFRLLWMGNVATQAGYWMFGIAQGWLVLQMTDSAFWLGMVGFANGIPLLLFALVGGELADRFNRRTLLLIYQSFSMIFITIFAILVTLNIVELWHVIAVAFLFGTMMALNIPLRQALMPELVEKEDWVNATALNAVGFNSMRVVGPALAGVLIATIGMLGIFWLMVVGYVWALTMVVQMKLPPRQNAAPRMNPFRSVANGLIYIRSNREIMLLMVMITAPTLFAMPYVQLLPIFARDVLQVGVGGLGVLSSAVGIGALVTSLLVASWGNVRHKGWYLIIGSALFGASIAIFGASQWYWLSIVALGLSGICWSLMNSYNNVLLQFVTPNEYRGRVFSVYTLMWGMQPLGNLAIGWLAEVTSASLAVTLGGIISVLCVIALAIRSRRLREMD